MNFHKTPLIFAFFFKFGLVIISKQYESKETDLEDQCMEVRVAASFTLIPGKNIATLTACSSRKKLEYWQNFRTIS
jgi:hypothetical protein